MITSLEQCDAGYIISGYLLMEILKLCEYGADSLREVCRCIIIYNKTKTRVDL